jgi:S-adenosylmethionine synthetase
MRSLFASESVSKGHPDKMADLISDSVLDAALGQDPHSRVACETLVATGMVMIAGEITTQAHLDLDTVARDAVKEIGYTDASMGFDCHTCAVLSSLNKQSPDISQGVSIGQGLHAEQGAGDQGLMFGYAARETETLMPLPITLAHQLIRRVEELREDGTLRYLRPDGKSQVVVEYEERAPVRVHTVLLSNQHSEEVTHAKIADDLIEKVVRKVIPADLLDEQTILHINPTGRFVVGGPHGDCGLTGRKIIVDTYGGRGAHGGGAFSGKDPSKVDRSAAYATRWVAKNLVAAGLCEECLVQASYAIGVAPPLSVKVDSNGTGTVCDARLSELVQTHFDLRPAAIIERLDLLRPIYAQTAAGGHFGREEADFTWERTDMAEALKADA